MLGYFAFTLFVSSALLFLVQPMVGKMILPHLGGTPAVWNTCMVFFQAALLLGYAYTHTLSTAVERRRQLVIHLALLALPLLCLPFSLGSWQPPAADNPIGSILWLLLLLVGLPFFVVATSAPLLQKWFASTGHHAAGDPYFLYAASNLGSMLALLSYPVLVEPFFSLNEQTWLWTGAYILLAVLVLGCALVVWRSAPVVLAATCVPGSAAAPAPAVAASTALQSVTRAKAQRRKISFAASAQSAAGETTQPLTWGRRLRWIGLAAAPSSMLLGITTYITTDIAAMPLLWVLPLAAYLLTFILAYLRWPILWTDLPHTFTLYLQPFLVMSLVMLQIARLELPPSIMLVLHLLVFLTTVLMCHGELARDRPPASFLTEYYLWLSVGGVLGGMFNALVAPVLFWFGVVEYPLAGVLACLLRPNLVGHLSLIPGDSRAGQSTRLGLALDLAIPLVLGLGIWVMFATPLISWLSEMARKIGQDISPGRFLALLLLMPTVVCLSLSNRPLRYGLSLAAILVAAGLCERGRGQVLYESRGFFGFLSVRQEQDVLGNDYRVLIHGTIDHGRQYLDPKRRRLPISYFHPTGGIGQLFETFKWPDARLPASLIGLGTVPWGQVVGLPSEPPYAVVGLGVGTLAAHGRPLQHVTFYEIDPAVKHLSLPPPGRPAYFTYLQDALDRGTRLQVILGDGRRSLHKAPERYYHILVLDAFSSDAIPVHLLSAEALDLYLSKLADGGVLVFNTTNIYVDIRPVLADLAKSRNLTCLAFGDYQEEIIDKSGSDWVLMQRPVDQASPTRPYRNGGLPLQQRLDMNRWKTPKGLGGPIWTDDYSNLLRVLNW